MANKFVRQSKFRHVFGTGSKQENCYNGVKMTKNAWDTNMIKAATKHFSMIWHTAGGGSFATIPYEMVGKHTDYCMFSGHKGAILDIDYNPFNENLIASCSEDCTIQIWQIPEEIKPEVHKESVQTLQGHKRKVGTLNFHPCASNILATTSADLTLKIWDIEKGEDYFTVGGHTDIVNSVSWNKDGSLAATTSKDKKLRIFDPRTQQIVAECTAHLGSKGIRNLWMQDKNRILTTGFSRQAEREMIQWDPRNLEKPINRKVVDNQSGVLMPFYDPDTSILYLAGKGDGNILYYEIVDDKPYQYDISTFGTKNPQSGIAMLPKRAMNVSTCEIARFLKLTPDKVEPISFCVPRKSEMFQDDLYCLAYAGIPSLTAEQWKSGENKDPDCSYDMAPGYVPPEKPAAEFKPVVKEVAKPKTEKELLEENEQLRNRVSYLETELAKRDQQIADLKKAAEGSA